MIPKYCHTEQHMSREQIELNHLNEKVQIPWHPKYWHAKQHMSKEQIELYHINEMVKLPWHQIQFREVRAK
jgi:hypothetical protein